MWGGATPVTPHVTEWGEMVCFLHVTTILIHDLLVDLMIKAHTNPGTGSWR